MPMSTCVGGFCVPSEALVTPKSYRSTGNACDVGSQLYVMPPFCDKPPTPSFEGVLDEVRFYGKLLGTAETTDASAAALEAAVASRADAPIADGQTSAALYVSSDGSAIYAYSSPGMAHPLGAGKSYISRPGNHTSAGREIIHHVCSQGGFGEFVC